MAATGVRLSGPGSCCCSAEDGIRRRVATMAGGTRATVYSAVYRCEDLGEEALFDRRHSRPPAGSRRRSCVGW
jgi:hypothetical protein